MAALYCSSQRVQPRPVSPARWLGNSSEDLPGLVLPQDGRPLGKSVLFVEDGHAPKSRDLSFFARTGKDREPGREDGQRQKMERAEGRSHVERREPVDALARYGYPC